MSRTATILIRTWNEERHLGATLDALAAQSVSPSEVIVLDSGSTDCTLAIAEQHRARILTIPAEQWSYPRALNVGFSHAKGDIVSSLSAHCRPATPEWLWNLLRHFDDDAVAAAWGRQIYTNRPLPVPGPPQFQEPGVYGPEYRSFGLSNATSAIRRRVWESLRFDESLPAAEDVAWGLAALAHGYTLVYDPAAMVRHELHGFLREYRRDRAVADGLNTLFPETYGSVGNNVRRLLSDIRRIINAQRSDPDPRELWRIARRVPINVMTIARRPSRRRAH